MNCKYKFGIILKNYDHKLDIVYTDDLEVERDYSKVKA